MTTVTERTLIGKIRVVEGLYQADNWLKGAMEGIVADCAYGKHDGSGREDSGER